MVLGIVLSWVPYRFAWFGVIRHFGWSLADCSHERNSWRDLTCVCFRHKNGQCWHIPWLFRPMKTLFFGWYSSTGKPFTLYTNMAPTMTLSQNESGPPSSLGRCSMLPQTVSNRNLWHHFIHTNSPKRSRFNVGKSCHLWVSNFLSNIQLFGTSPNIRPSVTLWGFPTGSPEGWTSLSGQKDSTYWRNIHMRVQSWDAKSFSCDAPIKLATWANYQLVRRICICPNHRPCYTQSDTDSDDPSQLMSGNDLQNIVKQRKQNLVSESITW